jgi:hypothetical protein
MAAGKDAGQDNSQDDRRGDLVRDFPFADEHERSDLVGWYAHASMWRRLQTQQLASAEEGELVLENTEETRWIRSTVGRPSFLQKRSALHDHG